MQQPISPRVGSNTKDQSLHFDVAKRFKDDGWDVDIRPHYTDTITRKTRELRLQAIRTIADSNSHKNFYQVLSISCEYLTADVVYYSDDVWKFGRRLTHSRGFNDLSTKERFDPSELLEYQWHTTAKLFDAGDNGDAASTGEEPVYSGIRQTVRGLVSNRGDFPREGVLHHAIALFRSRADDGTNYHFFDSEDLNKPLGTVCADVMYTYYSNRDPQAHQQNERFNVILAQEDHLHVLLQHLRTERDHMQKKQDTNSGEGRAVRSSPRESELGRHLRGLREK